MIDTIGYAAHSAEDALAPFSFERRDPGPTTSRSTSCSAASATPTCTPRAASGPGDAYPCVPGHEIVGRVTAVGAEVRKFKVGDMVGVGCMVDSCQHCATCDEGLEQYCENGFTGTYNGPDQQTGGNTYGGYSASHRGRRAASC